MASYQFSMNKILDWRLDQEEEASTQVKRLEEELHKEEHYLNQLLQESKKVKNQSLFSSGIDSYKRHDMYKELIDGKIIQQKQKVAKAEQAVETAQEALLQAHKDKKVMEKLDEKEREKFAASQKKEEQKQLDELSTLQYGRSLLFPKS